VGRGTGVSIIFINPYLFGAPWTPANITTELWLDAADASTITESSGAVSQWDDKSGNNRNATQTTGANQPQYISAGKNSLNLIRFTAANAQFFVAGSTSTWNFLHNGTDSSVFTVARVRSTGEDPNAAHFLFDTHSLSGGVGFSVFYDDRTIASRNNALVVQIARGVAGFNAALISDSNKITPGDYNIIGMYLDADNATAANRIKNRINGAADFGANTLTGAPSASNSTYALNIGGAGLGSTYLTGDFCEILILSTQPSTSDRQLVEGYLAHKWGLLAGLPNDHPYKTTAPTI